MDVASLMVEREPGGLIDANEPRGYGMAYINVFATTLSYRSIPLKFFSVKHFNCCGIIEMLPSTIMSTARHTGKLYYTIE